ncbi:MAG TPA: DEAD/DEAH box helicase family protein [Flavobacteriaceae bacterium]|nr:DEAD/DEAH box helicase family protein [Flavobacteriaceae bacterium]
MTRQFEYEKQTFQEECVQSILRIFGGLHQNQAFEKVMRTHHQENNYPFPVFTENKNIDIMMETGTGKTFTFIQTMLELCKQYGYKKFIILIPTTIIGDLIVLILVSLKITLLASITFICDLENYLISNNQSA